MSTATECPEVAYGYENENLQASVQKIKGLSPKEKPQTLNEIIPKNHEGQTIMGCVKPIQANTPQGKFIVPCGKCLSCLKARKNAWAFRLRWEEKDSITSYFITLTYNPKSVPIATDGKMYYKSLRREDLIRFHKSLRKANHRWYLDQGLEIPDYQMKYYSVGEYGTETHRPHYHIILFNLRPEIAKKIGQIWGKGHVKVGTVRPKSIAYTTKYLIDQDERYQNSPIEKPFSIMSKGLGQRYLRANKEFHKHPDDTAEDWRMFVMTEQGHKQALPRFYKNQLFDELERAEYSELHKNDHAERYFIELEKLSRVYGEDFDKRYWINKRDLNNAIRTKSIKSNKL